MQSSSLRGRMARGAFWSLFSTGTNRVLALCVSVLVARLVGKAHFGELGVVQSTISVFGLLAGFGTSMTATRYVSQTRTTDPERAGRIIALASRVVLCTAGFTALVVIALAPWMATRVLNNSHLAPLLTIGAGALFFEAWNAVKAGALAGLEAFDAIARIDLVVGLLGVVCTAIGVWQFGVSGALGGAVLGLAAHNLGYSLALRDRTEAAGIQIDARGSSAEWRVLLRFSLPALLAAAVAASATWLCRVIVVREPDGYGQMGWFNAAAQWRTAILFLPATLSHSFFPVMSNLFGNRDRRSFQKILITAIQVNTGLALVAGIGVALTSQLLLAGYGPSFAPARGVMIVLAAAAVLSASVTVVGQVLSSAGWMWRGLALNGIWAAVLLTAAWALRQRGAYGLALANLIAYGVHLVTSGLIAYVMMRRVFAEPDAS